MVNEQLDDSVLSVVSDGIEFLHDLGYLLGLPLHHEVALSDAHEHFIPKFIQGVSPDEPNLRSFFVEFTDEVGSFHELQKGLKYVVFIICRVDEVVQDVLSFVFYGFMEVRRH